MLGVIHIASQILFRLNKEFGKHKKERKKIRQKKDFGEE